MIDVTVANFEQEVIAASMQIPVLVDLWAPWCGPCKVLGPILEKLETDFNGRFKLVKIDTDENPQIAAAFGVRSIPLVYLLIQGRPVAQFNGAMPEGQIRAWLEQHLPKDETPQEFELALAALDAGDLETAEKHLKAAIAIDPADHEARFVYANVLLDTERAPAAKEHAALIPESLKQGPQWEEFAQRLEAASNVQIPGLAPLLQAIERNPADLQARLDAADLCIQANAFEPALEQLLEIVSRDRKFQDDIGRTRMIEVFNKASDAPQLVSAYRRKLSAVVLS